MKNLLVVFAALVFAHTAQARTVTMKPAGPAPLTVTVPGGAAGSVAPALLPAVTLSALVRLSPSVGAVAGAPAITAASVPTDGPVAAVLPVPATAVGASAAPASMLSFDFQGAGDPIAAGAARRAVAPVGPRERNAALVSRHRAEVEAAFDFRGDGDSIVAGASRRAAPLAAGGRLVRGAVIASAASALPLATASARILEEPSVVSLAGLSPFLAALIMVIGVGAYLAIHETTHTRVKTLKFSPYRHSILWRAAEAYHHALLRPHMRMAVSGLIAGGATLLVSTLVTLAGFSFVPLGVAPIVAIAAAVMVVAGPQPALFLNAVIGSIALAVAATLPLVVGGVVSDLLIPGTLLGLALPSVAIGLGALMGAATHEDFFVRTLGAFRSFVKSIFWSWLGLAAAALVVAALMVGEPLFTPAFIGLVSGGAYIRGLYFAARGFVRAPDEMSKERHAKHWRDSVLM